MKPENKKALGKNILKVSKKLFGSYVKSIEVLYSPYIKKHKIVVFVPLEKTDELAFAMASEGAGIIGNYTVCSFRIKGVGTFIGNEHTSPKIGSQGKYEMVNEVRLEMLCSPENLDSVIRKVLDTHPYEEPAYEIYDVMVRNTSQNKNTALVKLKRKFTVKHVLERMNKGIKPDTIPSKLDKITFKQAVIDFSDDEIINNMGFRNTTLHIRKTGKLTKMQII